MIDSKQAARLRAKKRAGKNLSAANERKLAEYEAARASSASSASSPPTDQQSAPETAADGGAGNPDPSPRVDSSPDPAPPADSDPAPMPPPPGVEPPPHVPPAPVAVSSSGKQSGDWRDKWRQQVNFSGDGRQMLCEQVGLSIVAGLAALHDETKKVTTPKLDPRNMAGFFVLAVDELMPERAKLTPKIGAALTAVVVVGERYYYAEQIKEHLATDPEHQAWLKKQAAKERADREAAEKHAAETAPSSPPPQYAEPPPAAPTVNGTPVAKPAPAQRSVKALAEDPDALY